MACQALLGRPYYEGGYMQSRATRHLLDDVPTGVYPGLIDGVLDLVGSPLL
jgi:hypothetical protein